MSKDIKNNCDERSDFILYVLLLSVVMGTTYSFCERSCDRLYLSCPPFAFSRLFCFSTHLSIINTNRPKCASIKETCAHKNTFMQASSPAVCCVGGSLPSVLNNLPHKDRGRSKSEAAVTCLRLGMDCFLLNSLRPCCVGCWGTVFFRIHKQYYSYCIVGSEAELLVSFLWLDQRVSLGKFEVLFACRDYTAG